MMVVGWFDCRWMYIGVSFGLRSGWYSPVSRLSVRSRKLTVLQVGVNCDPQPEALEMCHYFLPGTVRLTSIEVSKNPEPVISIESSATILVFLRQLCKGEQANQLAYFCAVKAPHRHVEEAAAVPFPPFCALIEEQRLSCVTDITSISSSLITTSF